MELSQARILITGGAKGIGNYLAMNLLEKASKIIILDKDEKVLQSIETSEKLRAYACDITNVDEVRGAIDTIFTQEGGINVLINNAGIIHSEPLINLLSRPDRKHNVENWNRVINVNLSAVFLVTSHVVDHMVRGKEKGVIINISSIAAEGNIGQSAYSATKAAVEALTKTWSKELGMFKIRSVCIAPGFFDTPSTRQSLNEHMLNKWEKAVPLNKLGELKELLSAAEFLIQNEYYNGKILQLDGGLTI